MTGQMPPIRPALRWFGGKWRLALWIIQHFPPHNSYVEPYGGSAAVLLQKPPAALETYNDRHQRLVNFFRVLRDAEEDLLRAIERTPYSRAEYEAADQPSDDPIEDARRFYVLAQQGRPGSAAGGTFRHGWRYERDAEHHSFPADHFAGAPAILAAAAARLKHVQIECDDALGIVDRYDAPSVLLYVDPPYPLESRARARYRYELTNDDHRLLADRLHQARGMVVLSGYLSPLYQRLYADWLRVDCYAMTDGPKVGTESLWLNPAAAAAQRQQSLFSSNGRVP